MRTGKKLWSQFCDLSKEDQNQEISKKRHYNRKIATMMLIKIDDLFPDDTNLSTPKMDTSNAPLEPETPDDGALMAHPARSPPPQHSPPLLDQNFIETEAISEAAETTPEGISNWITEILETFKYLLANQYKQRLH